MKHYFTRLEESIKKNWERPALGNFRGELFTFGELAENIAKLAISDSADRVVREIERELANLK